MEVNLCYGLLDAYARDLRVAVALFESTPHTVENHALGLLDTL